MNTKGNETQEQSRRMDASAPIVLKCPSCGHLLRLFYQHLGIKGNCVSCSCAIMGAEISPGRYEAVYANPPEIPLAPLPDSPNENAPGIPELVESRDESTSVAEAAEEFDTVPEELETLDTRGEEGDSPGLSSAAKSPFGMDKDTPSTGSKLSFGHPFGEKTMPESLRKTPEKVPVPSAVSASPEEEIPASSANPFSNRAAQPVLTFEPGPLAPPATGDHPDNSKPAAKFFDSTAAPLAKETTLNGYLPAETESPPSGEAEQSLWGFTEALSRAETQEPPSSSGKLEELNENTEPMDPAIEETPDSTSLPENTGEPKFEMEEPPLEPQKGLVVEPYPETEPIEPGHLSPFSAEGSVGTAPSSATPFGSGGESAPHSTFSHNQFGSHHASEPEESKSTEKNETVMRSFMDDGPLPARGASESSPKVLPSLLDGPKFSPPGDSVNFSTIKLKSTVPPKRRLGTTEILIMLVALSILGGIGAYIWTPLEKREELKTQLAEWLAPGTVVIQKLPFVGKNLPDAEIDPVPVEAANPDATAPRLNSDASSTPDLLTND